MKIKSVTVAAMILVFLFAMVAMAHQDPRSLATQIAIAVEGDLKQPKTDDKFILRYDKVNVKTPLMGSPRIGAISSEAQEEPCTVAIDKLPAIHRIKFGMTVSEVKAFYPGISEPEKQNQTAGTWAIEERLKGVGSLWLHFFHGKVYHIAVNYKPEGYSEARALTKLLDWPDDGTM